MIEKAGGKLDELFLTWGNYKVVVIGSANDFETVGAIKMMIISTWAFDESVIFEETDFNKLQKKHQKYQVFISLQTLEVLNKENNSKNNLFYVLPNLIM